MIKASSRGTEWILTLLLISVLVSLIIIAKIQSSLFDSKEMGSVPIVSVEVIGAVEKPGIYSCEAGTPLGEVLKRAKPHRFTNLRNLNLEAGVKEDRVLVLEELETILVYLGNKEIEVPPGTRVCDLKKFIDCPKTQMMKSRRILRDREIVGELIDK